MRQVEGRYRVEIELVMVGNQIQQGYMGGLCHSSFIPGQFLLQSPFRLVWRCSRYPNCIRAAVGFYVVCSTQDCKILGGHYYPLN